MNPYLLDVASAMGGLQVDPSWNAPAAPVAPAPAPAPTAPQAAIPDALAAGAAAQGIAPPPAAPAPTAAGLYDGSNSSSIANQAPIRLPGVPAPAPAAPGPAPASAPIAPGMSALRGTLPAEPPVAAPTPEQAPALASPGAVIPAHEVQRFSPSQWAALEGANQTQQSAIGEMAANSLGQAARDEEVYLRQAQEARAREDAATQVAYAREDELRQRAADFDRQARQLSRERIDPNHLWATKTTPQKIATFISIALGGFLSGARGGENVAMQRVNEEIDRDVRAQEFAFHAKRQGVEAAQTAYGMALQRYQSADAARAFARVSAMDSVAAEIQRQAAQAKTVEVKNRALAALTELQQARADQIMKGIAYIPSQYVEPKYRPANRLGSYTLREIDEKQIAPGENRGFELGKIDRTGAWKLREEAAKSDATRESKLKDTTVVLPSGETVTAPNETEAGKLRDLAAQDHQIRRLMARAIELRREGFRTNPGNAGELKSIQMQLRTAFSTSAELGALSKDDIKIADGAVGELADPTSLTSAPERQLKSYADMVRNKVANRVKTYKAGQLEAPRAAGVLPSGFRPGLQ